MSERAQAKNVARTKSVQSRAGSRAARAKLMMTAATLATGFVGYGRGAYACTPSSSYRYTCSGSINEATVIESIYGENVSVNVTGDTDITVGGQTAIEISNRKVAYAPGEYDRSGDVSVSHSGDLIQGDIGLDVTAEGGVVYLGIYGDVVGTASDGIQVNAGSVGPGYFYGHYINVSGDVTATGEGKAIHANVDTGGAYYSEYFYGGQPYDRYGTALYVRVYGQAAISGGVGIDLSSNGSRGIDLSVGGAATVTAGGPNAIIMDSGETNGYNPLDLRIYDEAGISGNIVMRGQTGGARVYIEGTATVTGDIIDETIATPSSNQYRGPFSNANGSIVVVEGEGTVVGNVDLGQDNDLFGTNSTSSVTGLVDGGSNGEPTVQTFETAGLENLAIAPVSGDELVFGSVYAGPGGSRTATVDVALVDWDGQREQTERFVNFERVTAFGFAGGPGGYGAKVELTGQTEQYGTLYAIGAVEVTGDAENLDLATYSPFLGSIAQPRQGSNLFLGQYNILGGTGTIGNVYGSGIVISPGALTVPDRIEDYRRVVYDDPDQFVVDNGSDLDEPMEPVFSPIMPLTSEIGTLTVAGDINLFGGLFGIPYQGEMQLGANAELTDEPVMTIAPGLLDIQIAADGSADRLNVGGSIDLSQFDLLVRSADPESAFDPQEGVVIVDAQTVSGTFNNLFNTVADLDVVVETTQTQALLSWGLSDTQSDKSVAAIGGFAARSGHLAFTDAIGAGLNGVPVGAEVGQIEATSSAFAPLDSDTTALVSNARVFGNVLGEQSKVDAQDGLAGLDASITGGFVGVQTSTTVSGGTLSFGGAIGQTNSEAEVEDGTAEVTGLHAGVFAGLTSGDITVSGVFSFASLDMETFRELGAIDGVGKTEGTSWAADLTLSRDISDLMGSTDTRIAPFVGYRTVNTKFDGFSEAGTTLVLEDTEISTQFFSLGAELGRDVTVGQMDIGTSLTVGIEHAMGDLSVTSVSNVGVGDDFVTETAPIDENRAILGLGISFGQDNLTGNIGFEGVFGANSSNTAVVLGVSYKF